MRSVWGKFAPRSLQFFNCRLALLALLAFVPAAATAQLGILPDFALKDFPPDRHISRRKAIPRDLEVAHMHGPPRGDLLVTNTGGTGGEPSIAINPLDTNFIAITSFAGNDNQGNAALFYSTDRGLTWKEFFSIKEGSPPTGGIPNDQDIDFDSGGALQGSFLTFNLRVASGGTTDPVDVNAWAWPIDGSGNLAFSDINGSPFGTDQPWMLINKHPVLPSDVFYSGYDDFGTGIEHVAAADIPIPGIPGVTFSRDISIGNFDGQFVNPGLRLGNDRTKGYMYAIWQFATGQNPDGSANVNWNLNRTTDGGNTWSLNGNPKGIVIAQHASTQPWPKFAGVNALLGGVNHVAVDPNNGDVYCVVGNRDMAIGVNRLSLLRLTDDGSGGLQVVSETFVGITGSATTSQFALPSIAVADGGAIGILYDEFEGNDPSGFARFTAHVAISYDQGATFDDTPILTFLATELDDGFFFSRQRILGDYQQMKAVGDTFFGAFTANQAALGGQAVMGPTFFSIDAVPPGLKLSIDPNPVFAGQTSTGTLTLKDPAPVGGLDVQVSSSNPPLATVPALVHINEGQLTATFPVQTADIGAPFPAPVITAISGTFKSKATLQFVSVKVKVTPQLVFAGDTVPATINIGLPAPPGGVDVKLSSSNAALAAVPATVHFNEGDTQQVVDVVTNDIGLGATDVDISAVLGPNTAKYTITIVPYIVSVEFLDVIFWTPSISVTGGQFVQSRVTIAQEAPTPGGVVVNLISGDPNICQVTPSITVPAGQIIQYFYTFTNPVANDQSVEIRASARGSSRAGVVTVLAPVPQLVTLSPTTVVGGNPSGGTVFLTGVAPNTGLDVTLSSDKPDAIPPSVVHIQPGKNLGTFVVNTTPVANKVIANIAASYNGVSVSAPLTITGAGLQTFTISPSQIPAGGGAKATAVLSSPAPPGGATVALSYVNGNALVNPPASIPIAAGATSGSVNLTAAVVTNSTTVTVTATYKSTSKQATVTVLGNRVVSVTANPQTLHLSTKAACKVYLASPAPIGGVVVNLAATSGELPVSVRVLAGQNSAAFSYKAPGSVPPAGKATITATYPAGVTVSTVVSIIP